jgi:hypothetical protein
MTRGILIALENGVFDDLEQHGKAWRVPMDYPAGIERQVVLKNGETVRIRPIRPDDEPRLVALYDRLSRHTAYQRFFTVRQSLPQDWVHYFANVDYRRRFAWSPSATRGRASNSWASGAMSRWTRRGRARSPSCWKTAIGDRDSAPYFSPRWFSREPSAA